VIPGFNHNIKHNGKIYHIQTEDSGLSSPHIITLLYEGGTILAREKTGYADIIKVDDLETVVRDLMEEQHKKMLRNLLAGEFDKPSGISLLKDQKPLTKEEQKKKFGDDVISDKALDEVILDFLSVELSEKKN